MPRILCCGGQGCLGSITRWTEGRARHWSRHRAGASDAMFSGRAELRPRCCQLQAFGWSRPCQRYARDKNRSPLAMTLVPRNGVQEK